MLILIYIPSCVLSNNHDILGSQHDILCKYVIKLVYVFDSCKRLIKKKTNKDKRKIKLDMKIKLNQFHNYQFIATSIIVNNNQIYHRD